MEWGADIDLDGCIEITCCVDFSLKIRVVLGRSKKGAGRSRPIGCQY